MESLDPFYVDKMKTEMQREEISDETDARPLQGLVNKVIKIKFSSINEKVTPQANEQPVVWGSKDAVEYDMRHRRRGVALIFNHTTFKRFLPRNGAEKDCRDLVTQFTSLGFEVKVHKDLEYKKLREVLESTSKEDHTDADCLVVIVMTHGEPGHICARDHPYREEELWRRFTGDKCASLLGKPKLFFIQACRGDLVDDGIKVSATVTDSCSVATYMIPTQADILLSYATVDGYRSWRNPQDGAWYIQALCEELALHGRTHDLLTIMTFVSRRVAVDYMSNIRDVPTMNMKIQMPAFTSMLTRLVYFRDKTKKTTLKMQKARTGSDEMMQETDVQDETVGPRLSVDRVNEQCTCGAKLSTVQSSDVHESIDEQVSTLEVVTTSALPVRETSL